MSAIHSARHGALGRAALGATLLLLAACGGGGGPVDGGGGHISYVRLKSDVGDVIGFGVAFEYTRADAQLQLNAVGGHLSLQIVGDERWAADFSMPSSADKLEVGTYGNLTKFPFHDPAVGGLALTRGGLACSSLTGWFAVDHVTYLGGVLSELDLRFEQHCDGGAPAMHGELHWDAADTTPPPGPAVPPPGLWAPPPGSTPATGSYVYLESDEGDDIGFGRSYSYDDTSALFAADEANGYLAVTVTGDERWHGAFQAMSSLTRLEPGFYGGLMLYPLHNPVRGGLAWGGELHPCIYASGWFVVDAVSYAGGQLTSVDLRFEQHCGDRAPALRGALRWQAGGGPVARGPVVPVPAGLWAPAAGATPATGTFVYLQSDAQDYVGQGRTYTYTQATADLSIFAAGGLVSLTVAGDEAWLGAFVAMTGLSRLEPGYYPSLRQYPSHNPARGGLDWSGEARSCRLLEGWFAVDSITYAGTEVTALDLRFEQRCGGGAPALHGAIHWDAADPTRPPGPVEPPPAGLWAPAAGSTPATGNFVHLETSPVGLAGSELSFTYTQVDSILSLSAEGGHLGLLIRGDQTWSGALQAMSSVSTIERGYYGTLGTSGSSNPAKGSFQWNGTGLHCSTATGNWLVVDAVTYSGSTLTAIDLRFEQACTGQGTTVRGAVHWDASDTSRPPGPVEPPPPGLWAPPAGATPAAGNYVYVESEPGDPLGEGRTVLRTPADSIQSTSAAGNRLLVSVWAESQSGGIFQAMSSVTRLEPGYYGSLGGPYGNPARGGLSWGESGGSCSTTSGWFVVDEVTYTGTELTSIALRFEQHCNGAIPALHGAVRWAAP